VLFAIFAAVVGSQKHAARCCLKPTVVYKRVGLHYIRFCSPLVERKALLRGKASEKS